jgi:RraA family protein
MSQTPRSAEIHPGPGFRVRTGYQRLEPAAIAELGSFDTPDISDQLNRLYAVDPSISCLTGRHHKLCASVCTVKVFPGDNLMVHKALDVARPGDVVVVNSGGSRSNAVLGDIICTKAKHRGLAGFVVDGLVRDLPSILPLDFPVFACGTTSIGPLHRGPGEINYPIACGGVVVNPGDIVVADSAGIVVVPKEIVFELLKRLKQFAAAQENYLKLVRQGQFSNEWVDNQLASHDCVIET